MDQCYLNPEGMQNNELLACFVAFWSIILPNLGVSVGVAKAVAKFGSYIPLYSPLIPLYIPL